MKKSGTDRTAGHVLQTRTSGVCFARPRSKLTKSIRKPKATWVEPKFYAEVEYRDITSEGLLRQSSFKGLSTKRN